MASNSSKTSIEDSIQVALDAADTAAGVTEEFNSIKEQFEVQNIQVKRIYQSITIIFVSAISAAVFSMIIGFFMYYKTRSTLETNSNMAIESIAIFSENVGKLASAIALIETNTANQETIKQTLNALETSVQEASEDVANADDRYNNAIKIGISETERLIQQFATSTLEELRNDTLASNSQIADAVLELRQMFVSNADTENSEVLNNQAIATSSQITAIGVKIDELILLQKEIAAKLLEENRRAEAAKSAQRATTKPKPKPQTNPLKFP